MLRERAVGESLWESVLPAELRELPLELGRVDQILDEDRFFAPFGDGWRRLRVDATFVEADISTPTDSGLCSHAVSRLTPLAQRIERVGIKTRTRVRDRRRSVAKRIRAISGQRGRGRESLPAIDRLTGE